MSNSTDNKEQELDNQVEFQPEGTSFEENLLRSLIKGYETAWNTHNTKNEIKFELTITTHKVATPEGNKDCAYLRLSRGIREKLVSSSTTEELMDKTKNRVNDLDWNLLLIHQEVYWFKNLKEQLNPQWRKQLYINTVARLVAGGLEYAELLKKMQMIEEGKKKAGITEEERLNNIGLVKAEGMPTPLSKEDEEYKTWLQKERQKEGL